MESNFIGCFKMLIIIYVIYIPAYFTGCIGFLEIKNFIQNCSNNSEFLSNGCNVHS